MIIAQLRVLYVCSEISTKNGVLLSVIDFGLKQDDVTVRDVALQGLEKWRRLSNKASTNALVRTLRSMEKQHVADALERQVIAN